jgi:predicted nucleic acid-binding Zn ribbon protein
MTERSTQIYHCAFCTKVIPETSGFCTYCGSKQGVPASEEYMEKNRQRIVDRFLLQPRTTILQIQQEYEKHGINAFKSH